MASALSSTSSTTPSTATTSITPIVNPLLLLLSNMASMMTIKLDFTNYMVWKHQIVVILEAYSMIGFVDESCEAPAPFLRDSSGSFTREPNPKFVNWSRPYSPLSTLLCLLRFLPSLWVKNLRKEFGKCLKRGFLVFLDLMF